jgi:DEAD/DEAH box helicase domain-containing protein
VPKDVSHVVPEDDQGQDTGDRLTAADPVVRWRRSSQVRHLHVLPARTGVPAGWPDWLPGTVRQACENRGITKLWRHQTEAAEAVRGGSHTVVSTGTASGKTLAYLLPVMAATYGGPDAVAPVGTVARNELLRPRRPHTALYLAPTKALAHDQLRVCVEVGLDSWKVSTLDGDSDQPERDWAREYASYVLTNPDMLHRSVLPHHARWSSFLGSLRYVVIDESHRYRGVFGSHVAAVIRRLRRLAMSYGADPVFVLASATSTNVAEAAAELIGAARDDIVVVDRDASAHGQVQMLLWEPDGTADEDAAELLAESVGSGRQTIAFIPSRKMAELVAVRAQRELVRVGVQRELVAGGAQRELAGEPGRGESAPGRLIEAYRGGYLGGDRRRLERALSDGTLRGVAATNALELGVDIAGMDTVIIAGFPGTRAALWQQAGRAGRTGKEATVVLVSRKEPLDAYLFDHPELLFSQPVEATVLHADNPYVLAPHLAAAAQELPLTTADERFFGPLMAPLLDRLCRQGTLRQRPTGWFWTSTGRAVDAIDLRAAAGRSVEIVEADTGRVLGYVDQGAADATVHPGAVYLHQGETYLSEELDTELGEALVRAARPGYYTQPQILAGVRVVAERASRPFGLGHLHFGEVTVTSQVTGFLRRDEASGQVWDSTPLDLEQRSLRTTAVWWTIDAAALTDDLTMEQLAGGAHGAEHTSIGLLPLFAPCDRWDIGGLSTALHPDTGLLTVFVHDGQPGGSGFAQRGFEMADQWLGSTLERLESCQCEAGCPACVVSPKCGNGNQVLDKSSAIRLLRLLL